MSECNYLLWLSYESSGRILFPEGATTVGSEVCQVPICSTQAIRNLRSVETTIGIRQSNSRWTRFVKLKFGSDRVQTRTIAVTCDCTNHYTSLSDWNGTQTDNHLVRKRTLNQFG